MPTSGGGFHIVVTGTNFGPAGTVPQSDPVAQLTFTALSYGWGAGDYHLAGADCTVSTAHTVVSCQAAAGVGTALHFHLNVGGQSSNNFDGTSHDTGYGAPTVASVVQLTTPMATLGMQSVTVTGTNLGPLAARPDDTPPASQPV